MTIVVGYTPSPEAQAALETAIVEADRRAEPVLVLNTSPGDRYADRHFASDDQLATVRALLANSGVNHEILQPVRGRDAAEELLAAATDYNAALLVIGMRHRSPVGKLLLGSTAQRVLLDAPCPVLCVKADSHQNRSHL